MNEKFGFDAELSEKFKLSVASEADRIAFAATLGMPIQQELAPNASVRQIFKRIDVGPGAQCSFPVDMGSVNAWVMPLNGSVAQNIVEGEELFIPTYTIQTSVEYKEQYAREGRYDVAARAKEKMLNAIVTKEEVDGWTVIRAAATAARTVTIGGGTTLSKALLNKMFVKMASSTNQQYKIDSIFCSPTRFGDIREWTETQIDQVTQREIWQAGGLTTVWGAKVYELPSLGDNEVYGFDSRVFGVMPVRWDLQTRDNPIAVLALRVGIIAWEEIGFAALDNRGVVKATI